MLGYQPTRNLDIQLNFMNLFDKVYYRNIGWSTTSSYHIYGEPRKFVVNLKYRF